MERKYRKLKQTKLPPIDKKGIAASHPDKSGSLEGETHNAALKLINAAGLQLQDEVVGIPQAQHISIGEVVHPFKVSTRIVEPEGVYFNTGKKAGVAESASAALLPQDLYSSLLKKLPGQDSVERRKSILSVPQPQSILKYAIYPRKSMEKLSVFRVPSKEDLIAEVNEKAIFSPVKQYKKISSKQDLIKDFGNFDSSNSSVILEDRECVKTNAPSQES